MKKYKKISAEDLYYLEASNTHPANTFFHFSFANYYDPDNINFGVLKVLNDDSVKPHSGFGTHPHREMEIFSYVVEGKLTHRDSAGNMEILSRGHVQCISAGTGLTHSEMNEQDDWCRFLQIWVVPEKEHLPVRYDIQKFSFEERNNKLLQIISATKNTDIASLYLCQDVNVYVSELTKKDKRLPFTLNADRQAYIFCFEGSVEIVGYPSLKERDSLELFGQANLVFSLASDNAHFIIIEMQKEKYTLIKNIERKQYEFHIDGQIARIEYIKAQNIVYLTHTEIPTQLEGKGIGSSLVKQVLQNIKEKNLTLVPLCPFVALYIKRHPEWKVLVLKGINIT